jgi:hypothetical protein
MWASEGPYSLEELREMRRLIVASGTEVATWAQRTRRSAEFVRSLSPEQANVIIMQALAVAAEPDDLGTVEELEHAAALFADVAQGERHKRLWHLLLEIRHRHYPDTMQPDEDWPNAAEGSA